MVEPTHLRKPRFFWCCWIKFKKNLGFFGITKFQKPSSFQKCVCVCQKFINDQIYPCSLMTPQYMCHKWEVCWDENVTNESETTAPALLVIASHHLLMTSQPLQPRGVPPRSKRQRPAIPWDKWNKRPQWAETRSTMEILIPSEKSNPRKALFASHPLNNKRWW